MQPLAVIAVDSATGARGLLRASHEIHGVAGKIDIRSALDSDIANDVQVGAHEVRDGHRRGTRDLGREIERKKRGSGTGVRVEGINQVVHGDYVEHVVGTFARDGDILNVKRLRVNGTADLVRPELSERTDVDV